eukprot:SAG31_NODE_427_length_15813_cov_13.679649_11_plen_124_part_00
MRRCPFPMLVSVLSRQVLLLLSPRAAPAGLRIRARRRRIGARAVRRRAMLITRLLTVPAAARLHRLVLQPYARPVSIEMISRSINPESDELNLVQRLSEPAGGTGNSLSFLKLTAIVCTVVPT